MESNLWTQFTKPKKKFSEGLFSFADGIASTWKQHGLTVNRSYKNGLRLRDSFQKIDFGFFYLHPSTDKRENNSFAGCTSMKKKLQVERTFYTNWHERTRAVDLLNKHQNKWFAFPCENIWEGKLMLTEAWQDLSSSFSVRNSIETSTRPPKGWKSLSWAFWTSRINKKKQFLLES